MARDLKRLCVFCGSSKGASKLYEDAALSLGAEMVKKDIQLVYGGGSVGLMGALALSIAEGGGSVYGVIPQG